MSGSDIDIDIRTSDTRTFTWQTRGRTLEVGYDDDGEGPPVLLLPALSTVSTRAEMWPVSRLLAHHGRTVCADWPGFGAGPWPGVRWRARDYRDFLVDLCDHLFDGPVAVVAAGHAAGYVLQVAAERPATWSRIALVAPTWRGPLPTVLGQHRALYALLRGLVQLPIVGHALYRLNVAIPVLASMYRGHVFADPAHVTPRLLTEKARVARQPGARFASAAFVTGALDPVRRREDFLSLVDQVLVPLLVIAGASTPSRSWQEMLPLMRRPEVTFTRVPGALAPHEENPAPVARALEDFLLAD